MPGQIWEIIKGIWACGGSCQMLHMVLQSVAWELLSTVESSWVSHRDAWDTSVGQMGAESRN